MSALPLPPPDVTAAAATACRCEQHGAGCSGTACNPGAGEVKVSQGEEGRTRDPVLSWLSPSRVLFGDTGTVAP
jgi:hypothetical protein